MKRPKINQTLFLCLLFVLLAACAGPAAEAPVESAATEAPMVQVPEATSVPAGNWLQSGCACVSTQANQIP